MTDINVQTELEKLNGPHLSAELRAVARWVEFQSCGADLFLKRAATEIDRLYTLGHKLETVAEREMATV